MLTGAVLTLKARQAALKGATRQELPELPLDELRQAGPLARLRGRAEEGLQMLADDLMEHGVLGVSRAIRGLCTRHPSGYRASRDPPMPTDRYARSRALGATDATPRATATTVWAVRSPETDVAANAPSR